ncbi:hypothetical protein PR048_024976 [Dryococelus australis]|uniref:Uncharacterized protein n=1 Tax=Dryococelus australis TaxID=614101 RepID=A0ABQ9GQ47_9NEOP|nr:hypothetical protein PR048_024976 [Dryococelus australis]
MTGTVVASPYTLRINYAQRMIDCWKLSTRSTQDKCIHSCAIIAVASHLSDPRAIPGLYGPVSYLTGISHGRWVFPPQCHCFPLLYAALPKTENNLSTNKILRFVQLWTSVLAYDVAQMEDAGRERERERDPIRNGLAYPMLYSPANRGGGFKPANIRCMFFSNWGRGDTAVRLLASHLGVPGFCFPRARSLIFACGNRARRCRWMAGFVGDAPPPHPISAIFFFIPTLLHIPYSSDVQDLDVKKSHLNLFTLSHFSNWLALKVLVGAARPRSRSEGAIRATLTRTPSASSILRARHALCKLDLTHGHILRGREEAVLSVCALTDSPELLMCRAFPNGTSTKFFYLCPLLNNVGGTVAERLACSRPTKASRVQSPAGSPGFHT